MAYKPLFSKNIIEEEEKEKTKSAKYKPLFAGEKSIQTETIDTTPATTPTMTEAPKKVELFKPIKGGSTAYSVDGKIYFPELKKATDVISQGTFKPTEQTVAERQKEHFELATQKYIDEGKIKNITLSKTVKDFMLGLSGTTEAMIGGLEWINPETMKPFFKEKADQVSSWQKTMTPEDMTFVDKLIAGAGSVATFFIPGLGVAKATTLLTKISPKIALLFGNSVSTTLESMAEAGSVYRQNLASGMNESEAGGKATKTFFANAILIGLTNAFGIFSDRTQSAIKKILLSAPIEGFQEAGQEMISNVNTGEKNIFEGALESGIIGTILGGGMSATGTFTGILPTKKSSKKDIEKAIKEIEQKAPIINQEEVKPTIQPEVKEQTPADKLISEIKQPAETPATKLSKQIKGEVVEKEVVEKADETTQSIQKAKAEGKSFDEWVKGQGEAKFYHGSPTGEFGSREIHIGTKEAAKQALEARIGIPASGKGWDGTTNYGDTLLAGQKTLHKLDPKGYNITGFNVDVPKNDFYLKDHPELVKATFGDGTKIPLSVKPNLFGVKLKGEMTNLPTSAMSDTKANATIRAMLKKGTAKRGYYYTNIGEDAGSISAVVPSKSHLEPLKTRSQLKEQWDKVETTKEESKAKVVKEEAKSDEESERIEAYRIGIEKAKREIENNEAVILDLDKLKTLNDKEDTKNHGAYSQAINKIFTEILPLVDNSVVKWTASSPEAGKTDFVTNIIKDSFNGIIMDGTLANYDDFIKRSKIASENGKESQIWAVISNPYSSWNYVRIREEETGRGISIEGFVDRYLGSIETVKKVLENNPEIKVAIKDTRKITNENEAIDAKFIGDKNAILAILNKIKYNKENLIKKLYEQNKETIEKYDTDRVGERGAESKQDIRKTRKQTGVSKISKEVRADKVTKKKIKVIDPISAVSKLIVKKPALPVLQEFKAKDGKIYSTDLEVAIKLDYNLPDGMYRIVGKDTIKTDTDPSEYPILPGIDKNVIAQTSTPILNNALKDAVNFVSKNEVKIELTGISLQISPGKIIVVATDSYRLYKKIIPAKTNITESIILSNPKKISDILSAIGDKSSISYSKETNLLRISGSNGDIFVKTIDGQYPDLNTISDIIPNYKYSYSINRDEMLNAIKDLKPFIHKNTQTISFDFDDQKGSIKLYAENKEINISKEITIDAKKVDVYIIGKDLQDFNLVMPIMGAEKMVLRHEYLKSVVETIDRENVFMSVFNKDSPVLFNENVIQKKSPFKTKSTREVEGFIPRDINSLENPLVNQMNDKLIKRSDIARGLSEKLNVPIRMGKFRMPKALGIFKPGQKVVRLKKGGLPVIFHEVGHYLDSNYDFSKDINKKERTALMEEYGFKYEGQTKKQRKEAFAEFLRFRLTGQRNKSDSYAPIFSTIFDKRLESLPEIKDVLDTAENDYMRWIQQPATAKILSHISIGSEDKGSFKERSITKIHDLYTSIKDDMHPIREYSKLYKKFTGKKLNLKDDPYILSRNLKGWVGKANVFLEQGTFGKTYWKQEDGKTVPNFKGKSFQEIIKPVELAGKTNDFRTYLVSQRVIELSKREKPITTGINIRDAYEAVNELETNNPEFKQIANDLYKYQNDLMDYAIESGLIGEESGKKIKEFNKLRVPFYRVMEETQSAYMGSKRKVGGNIVSPVRKIKGSEREIIDPLESIVKDTYSIINAVERNNIGIAMGNLANQHYELGRLFEEVDSPMKAVKVNVAEVLEKALETKELDIGDLEIGDLMVNIFRPMQDKGNNMLTVNFGDKQKTFQVEPRLFRTLQGLNIEDLGLIVKITSFPAKLLRAGATLTPDFSIRNPLRDQWTAFIYSKYGFVPGYDFVRGVFELFKKGDTYKLWRMGGGEHSMMVSLDRDYLQNNFDDIVRTRGGKAFQYVKNPIELLRVLSEIGEKGARLGEMIRASESGADPIEGAYASRELTLDFARMGSKAKAINAIIAFWNANVEGTDRLARNFKDYPAKTSFRILTSITLPSIILFLLNEDDPRWEEIPRWQKDLFWIIFTEDHIIRIPKPFEIGILFGSVPERVLEYMKKDDPEVFDQLKKSVIEGATPGFIPTGLLPIIETISNYSFFQERPIVPRGKEEYPAESQYGTYTSETAKEIGKIMKFSPSKIDNIIQGYTGGLGKYAVNVIDKVLSGVGKIDKPTDPAKSLEDYPVMKSFMIREPIGSSSESVNSVYNLYSKSIGERNYFNKLQKDGKIEEAEIFFNKSKNIIFAPLLTTVINDFSDINKSKEIIRESDLLSPEEKRESIKELNVLQTEIAKEILKTIKENR